MGVTLERRKYMGLKAVLLGAALLILAFAGTVHAQEADWDDPDYVKMMNRAEEEEAVDSNQATSSSKANPYTGLTYTHASSLSGIEISYGVDVSKWQAEIDWEAVKADGIDFAIIRIGYSTTSADPYFEENLKGAKAAGVAVGVYYFSQATTTAEAKSEANYVLKLLGSTTLTCPVVFDWETASSYRNKNVSGSKATKICQTFCDIVEAAGYTSMIYANYNDLTTWLDTDTLAASYKIWIARYNTTTWTASKTVTDWNYSWKYAYWQYSSSGKVDGISGDADVNFYYGTVEAETDYGTVDSSLVDTVTGVKVKSHSSTSELTISFDALSDVVGYEIWRSTAYNGTYKKIKTVKESTSYTNTGRTSGKEYYYKVRAYVKVDGEKIYGEFSDVAYAYTAKTASYKIVTTKKTSMRLHAGSSYKTVLSVAKGTALSVQAITTDSKGVRWYRVKTTVDDETVTGYVSSKYATVKVKKVTSVEAAKVTAKTITLSWKEQGGVTGYLIYRSSSRNGTYKRVAKVAAGTSTWKNTGLKTYTQYYYKIRAYSKVNGVTTYGAYSSIATLGTTKTSYKAKTTGSVNLRQYAGTAYKKLTSIPKGKSVRVYYRTKDKNGKTWYYVKVTVSGKTYKGYMSSTYIKKS
ncbi:MAG: SH3 domain-containing protein [Lachnospiraceae bacterium]|nr:SH3 domain-containing protein [Lachnospiraceae bacterium]